MGTSDPIEPLEDLVTLIHEFEFKRFSVSSPRFDLEELKRLNARMLHAMPFEQVEAPLARLGLAGVTPAFWGAVRANLDCLRDATIWWDVVNGPIDPLIENEPLLKQALDLLPHGV